MTSLHSPSFHRNDFSTCMHTIPHKLSFVSADWVELLQCYNDTCQLVRLHSNDGGQLFDFCDSGKYNYNNQIAVPVTTMDTLITTATCGQVSVTLNTVTIGSHMSYKTKVHIGVVGQSGL